MYSRCPSCLTYFRVTDHHLAIANGKVRCGQCQLVFNAEEHSVDDVMTQSLQTPAKTENTFFAEKNIENVDSESLIIESVEQTPVEAGSVTTSSIDDEFDFSENEVTDQVQDDETFTNTYDDLFPDGDINFDNFIEDKASLVTDENTLAENDEQDAASENNKQFTFDINESIEDKSYEDDDKVTQDEVTEIDIPLEINPIKVENLKANINSEIDGNVDFDFNESNEVIEEEEISEEAADSAGINSISEENELNKLTNKKDETSEDESITTIQSLVDEEVPFQLRKDLAHLDNRSQRRSRPFLTFIILIFVVSLSIVQLAFFRAFELTYAIPEITPYVEVFCQKVTCRYSGPSDIKKVQLLNRDVRIHPNEKNALLISAVMINNAYFSQPYPNIKIRLSDISGNVIAERIFDAETYLKKIKTPFLLMKSKTPVHVNFEVMDPGKDAINFEFQFL